MTTFSDSKKEMVEQVEEKLPAWTANATSIGLTSAQVTSLGTRTAAARTKLDAMIAARAASKSATIEFYTTFGQMSDMARDFVKTIRAYAETTNNDNVYALAQVPPPKTPAPIGVPETPTNLTATITAIGTVELAWVGSLEAGTQFRVERLAMPLTGGPGTWTAIGVVAEKKFTDTAVPQGQAGVSYRVLAQRSGGVSDASDTRTVHFGTPATLPQNAELKMAA